MKKGIAVIAFAALASISRPDSKAFLDQMDLNQPKMSAVKTQYNAGAYDNALNVWRNILMADLRKTPMGEFGWHGSRTASHMVTWADMLAGKITEKQYKDWLIANNRTYCTDVWGLSGAPGTLTRANWLAVPDKPSADGLSDFGIFIPLAVRYWQNQDATYVKKWFEISSDFSRNCYNDINPLSRDEKRASYPNLAWNGDAGSALAQASRVANIFKSMALLSKSVPGGSKASDWMDSLSARSDIPTAGSYDVFPSKQVADTALSLVKEHSIALQERYLTAGAVPNQRFSGIYALLLTGRYLDMFKSVQTTIKPNAEAAMLDYLTTMCYPDGGMLEQSLNYNEGDARRMEELLSIFSGVSSSWITSMDRAVDRFWQMEWALRGPTFSVPQIGNRRGDIAPEVWTGSTVRQNWINSQLAKYAPKGTLEQQINNAYGGGQPPVFTSIAFPYSGYYLQRSGWTMDDMALFFMAGRPQRGHSMRDKNAIQVSAYGRDLLVASGYPTYGSNSSGYPAGVETYLGEQSSAKVNTILVDDKDQNRTDAQQVYTDPVNSMWHSSPYFDFVEGLHDKGYGSETDVSHQRQTVFVKEAGAWVVLDNLFSTDQSSHTYRQTWNFQPYYTPTSGTSVFGFKENEVIIDSVNKRIYTADNDTSDTPNVYLYSFGNNVSYDKYFGSTAPVYGWYARGYGDGIPAVDVHARFSGVGNQQLITLIKPTKGLSSGITSLTDKGSGAVKGFDGETGGVAIKVRGTVGSGVTLSADGVNAKARTLVVTTVAGVVRGIVIGADTFSVGTVAKSGLGGRNYEFRVLADGGVEVQRIQVPRNFSWVATGGMRPDYGIATLTETWAPTAPTPSLPSSWASQDIGAVGLAGSATYNTSTSTYTVSGSGGDIWHSADQFRFAHQTVSGDCSIVARVTSMTNPDSWAKAGVMIRESLNTNARHVGVFVTPGNGVSSQYRTNTGGTCVSTKATGLTAPYWVKVTRTGNTFVTARSADGVTWTTMHTVTVTMASNVYIGLAVTSHNNSAICTATMDKVTIDRAPLPSPWASQDIGAVGLGGSATYNTSTSTFTVSGSGGDIWHSADNFRFVHQTASGDCSIVARVTSMTNPHVWAKAGVMIRESLNSNARNVAIFVTPSNGVSSQYRTATGGSSVNTRTTGLTAPYWVRVTRTGNTFVTARSADGVTWTTMHTVTVTMASNVYIGLAVSSNSNTATCTGTMTNVTVVP
jgi:regulation of enolase protein 1 (concanavalin A-like superfamily)